MFSSYIRFGTQTQHERNHLNCQLKLEPFSIGRLLFTQNNKIVQNNLNDSNLNQQHNVSYRIVMYRSVSYSQINSNTNRELFVSYSHSKTRSNSLFKT